MIGKWLSAVLVALPLCTPHPVAFAQEAPPIYCAEIQSEMTEQNLEQLRSDAEMLSFPADFINVMIDIYSQIWHRDCELAEWLSERVERDLANVREFPSPAVRVTIEAYVRLQVAKRLDALRVEIRREVVCDIAAIKPELSSLCPAEP